MRYIYLLAGLLLLNTSLLSQQVNGTIRGSVKTADNEPASFVSILIKETRKSIITDETGVFTIPSLTPGTYHLVLSLTGYESLEQELTLKSGEEIPVNFRLQLSRKQLDDVTVIANRRRFIKAGSPYVAKMPLKNIENPQVYTTVTRALLDDQLNVVYADALKNIPGVIMQLENNSAGGTVTSRGFSTQSFLRNGVPGIVGGGTLDPANIESIEAIKGPSGALYGSSLASFGGLFNRVTKKAYSSFGGSAGYTGGGYGLQRLEADVNTPLDKERKLLLRTNFAAYHEGSFQDAGFKSYVFVAPSFTYKISDKTQLTVEAEYKKEKANSFYRMFADGSDATGVRSPFDLKMDFNKRFSNNDLYVNTTTANLFAELKHQLSRHWTSQTLLTFLNSGADGASGYLSMKAGNDSIIRNMSYTAYNNIAALDVQQNFNGDFSIGHMRNRLLLGLDVYTASSEASSSGNIAYDVLSVAKPGTGYGALNRLTLLDRAKGLLFTRTKTIQNTYAAYVQDALNITDRLLVLAAVRVDYFDNRGTKNLNRDTTTGIYHQAAVSAKFGAVYQFIPDKLSLFANYMNGFQNIAPVLQPDGTTSSFKPSQANQWEAGIKAGSADGRLAGSISYYNINVSDITRADAPDKPAYTVQNGTQYSKGIEAELTISPVTGLFVIAGYAYNNSRLEKSSPALDGLRPTSAGPEHLANLWLSYRLSQGSLKGIGFGFGGNYASENLVIVSTTSHYALPSYTALNASLSYDQPRYRLIAKVDNLTNKKYFVGWSTTIPQMPIRFSAGATLKF